jgi:hypothetical protein
MLSSLLGRLYRSAVARMLGIDGLVKEVVAREVSGLDDSGNRQLADTLRILGHRGTTRRVALDVEEIAYVLASVSSAQYFLSRMRAAQNFTQPESLLEVAASRCAVEGLVMEFGVYRGASLRVIARHAAGTVFGFDSFQGLPEDWTHFQRKGRYSLEGQIPRFDEPNIELVVGLFDETLPGFLVEHPGLARFIHIDSDLYSSAVTVLEQLEPRIVPGTVIVFDEYFNYPGWEHHEYRAFQEFIARTGRGYEYIGLASSAQAVAVRITSSAAPAA